MSHCKKILFASFFLLGAISVTAREAFIPHEAKWRYINGDEVPPANWKSRDFDDSKWMTGAAPLGYGNYRLRTYVRSERNPRPITTYFRSSFYLDNPADWEKFIVEYKADDGAAVFLNGELVSIFNMPNVRPYDANTRATRTVQGWLPYYKHEIEKRFLPLLVKGKNTIAISAHQSRPESSDLNLHFSLTGVEKGIREKLIMEGRGTFKYSDKRQLPDDDWAEVDYEDSDWKSGSGVFGYGITDATTEIDFGSDPNDKPNCVWFRKSFNVDPDMDVKAISMIVSYDDAATFFFNGKEIFRHNLPLGYSDHQTPANAEFSENSKNRIRNFSFPVQGVLKGKNVLAVQIHGSGPENPDLSFKMQKLSVEYLPRKVTAPVIASKPTPKPDSGSKPIKPTPQTVIKVANLKSVQDASPSDWSYSSGKYLEIALSSYEKNSLEAAQRAYTAARWAGIFSSEGAALNPKLKHLILASESLGFAQEFLDLYNPYDDHDRIYEILNQLFEENEEFFRLYPKLAMAIAVVYDQSPPNSWPHHQVGQTILPRRLPDAAEAFKFWAESDRSGDTLHKLGKLSIGELKYVIDTPIPLDELKKAQDLRVRLSNLPELYPGIEYSQERLKERRYDWPFQDYSLEKIKEEGGICVDQAYYTSQVAKACGVPAMMVSGAGSNGNHAWVGFLDQREKWNFETGRYEEAKYITGETYDPQTWEQLTDHELSLLTERFQTSPRFQLSRVHSIFANEYLEQEKFEKAIKACELAIKSEGRNFEAWDLLVKAMKKSSTPEEDLRQIYQNGARTFGRIADLEAYFLKRQATSLMSEGKADESQKIRQRIISRNKRERPDLALQESKEGLDALIEEGTIDEQMAFYKQQVQKLKDAGLITYYGLTQPFLEHLRSESHFEECKEALEYTVRRMDFKEDSQLAEEFKNWKEDLAGK